MFSIEQRVGIVEERMADHNQLFTDMRQGLMQFEARVDARFVAIEGRFGQVDARLIAIDQKVDGLRHEMGTQFHWTVGIMLTGLTAIAAAILAQ